MPFVYRTHENPDPEKVESLLTLLHNQGVTVQKMGQEITPKEIQTILEGIEGLPNEPQISRLTLRTMKQAKYTTECSGHFGLAAKYTAILPPPFVAIRIFRSTESLRISCGDVWKGKEDRTL